MSNLRIAVMGLIGRRTLVKISSSDRLLEAGCCSKFGMAFNSDVVSTVMVVTYTAHEHA